MNLVEIIGYAASVFVAISMLMTNIKWLRVINFTGAILFVIYGAIISNWPILGVNAFIVVVNLIRIYQLKHHQDRFHVIEIDPLNNKIFQIFLKEHADNILDYFPEYHLDLLAKSKCLLIIRNMTVAGVFIYEQHLQDILVHVDYVIPSVRDFENAKYFYKNMAKDFKAQGANYIVAKSKSDVHIKYLLKMNFIPVHGESTSYVKSI